MSNLEELTMEAMKAHLRENVADDVVRAMLADALEDDGEPEESAVVRSLVGQKCYLPTQKDAEGFAIGYRHWIGDERDCVVEVFWSDVLAAFVVHCYDTAHEGDEMYVAVRADGGLEYYPLMRLAGYREFRGDLVHVECYECEGEPLVSDE